MAEVLELNNTNGELMHAGSRPHLSHDQEFCCPKRRLEVQLSEVSDETCDRVAAHVLASVDQLLRTAGSPQTKKPKTFDGCQPATAGPGCLPGSAQASPSTGAQPAAPAQQSPVTTQIRTPMGPPPAAPMPRLGSLLVAAQMASGAAGSCMGPSGMNSPLLLATQATLQATTASVVAAEVLAAASAPGGMHGISSACAGQGMPHALAGLLGSSISTALTSAAAAATVFPVAQQQLQMLSPAVPQPGLSLPQHAGDAAVLYSQAAAVTVAAGDSAAAREDSSECLMHTQQQAHDTPGMPVQAPTASPEVGTGAGDNQQPIMIDAVAGTAGNAPSAAAAVAAAAAAPAGVQLPSWLCEPSAELRASQAICKASLLTATAALARLSSPKGLSLAATPAAAAAGTAGRSTAAPAAAAAAAAAGGLSVSALGGSAWGPNSIFSPTLPAAAAGVRSARPSLGHTPFNSLAVAVQPPQLVYGVPALEMSAGCSTVWGLPLDPAAAAVTAAGNAGGIPLQLRVVSPCRPRMDVCGPPAATASEDAGSCSSSPRAAAAAAAACTLPTTLSAAAAKLTDMAAAGPKHSTQQQQQYSGASQPAAGSSVGGSSINLTADDASSPETSDDASSADPDSAAADLDAAAVVVHVAVTRRKASPVGTDASAAAVAAVPTKLQEQ